MADRSAPPDPDRVAPAWLTAPAAGGTGQVRTVHAPSLRAGGTVRVWTPPGAGDRVLLAHDGPEFDRRGGLGRYCAALVAAGRVPPFRLVLLTPGDRNDW